MFRALYNFGLDMIDMFSNIPNLILTTILSVIMVVFSIVVDYNMFGVSVTILGIVLAFILANWSLTFLAILFGCQKVKGINGKTLKMPVALSTMVLQVVVEAVFFLGFVYFIHQVSHEYQNQGWVYEMAFAIQVFVIFLVGIKAYTEVGKKLKKMFGWDIYIFRIMDQVHIALEKLFQKKLDKFENEEE